MSDVTITPPTATRAHDHRERQIAEVLVRYGLSYLAKVVGLERLVNVADGMSGPMTWTPCCRSPQPGFSQVLRRRH